jgi:hypothetical protein
MPIQTSLMRARTIRSAQPSFGCRREPGAQGSSVAKSADRLPENYPHQRVGLAVRARLRYGLPHDPDGLFHELPGIELRRHQ